MKHWPLDLIEECASRLCGMFSEMSFWIVLKGFDHLMTFLYSEWRCNQLAYVDQDSWNYWTLISGMMHMKRDVGWQGRPGCLWRDVFSKKKRKQWKEWIILMMFSQVPRKMWVALTWLTFPRNSPRACISYERFSNIFHVVVIKWWTSTVLYQRHFARFSAWKSTRRHMQLILLVLEESLPVYPTLKVLDECFTTPRRMDWPCSWWWPFCCTSSARGMIYLGRLDCILKHLARVFIFSLIRACVWLF